MIHQLLLPTEDGKFRCSWPGNDAPYIEYHDEEWGRPVIDDTQLFEKLCLEGFQAGLSWLTILRKRENFRSAFHLFDLDEVARLSEKDINRLLEDEGIIRHRGKIEATINNAARALDLLDEEGSLASYLWKFAPRVPYGRDGVPDKPGDIVTSSPSASALSKDLKKRGWKFVGPTTMYAFMQSMGLINDHADGCHVQGECEKLRIATVKKMK